MTLKAAKDRASATALMSISARRETNCCRLLESKSLFASRKLFTNTTLDLFFLKGYGWIFKSELVICDIIFDFSIEHEISIFRKLLKISGYPNNRCLDQD